MQTQTNSIATFWWNRFLFEIIYDFIKITCFQRHVVVTFSTIILKIIFLKCCYFWLCSFSRLITKIKLLMTMKSVFRNLWKFTPWHEFSNSQRAANIIFSCEQSTYTRSIHSKHQGLEIQWVCSVKWWLEVRLQLWKRAKTSNMYITFRFILLFRLFIAFYKWCCNQQSTQKQS